MASFNKRKLLPILFCFLFLSSFVATSVNAIDQKTSIFLSDQGDEYSTRFSSTNVVDSEGKLHVFVKKDFENNTFVILHIFNNQMVEIYRSSFSQNNIFQAYIIDEQVVLLFSHAGSYYESIIMMFSWSETGSNYQEIYTSTDMFYSVEIIAGENSFNLLFKEENPSGTLITQVTAYLNGTISERQYILPMRLYELVSLHILDGELFAFFDIYGYNDSSYTYWRTLIVVGIKGSYSYYNSTVLVVEDNFDRAQLFVGEDGKFHLTILEFQLFYSVSFGVNDTIKMESFQTINLGIYHYEKYKMISYQNTSFFLFVTSSYVEILDMSRYNPNFRSAKITIVEDDNQTISLFSFLIENVYFYYFYGEESYIEKVSITLFENRTYIASYPSLILTKTLDDYNFVQNEVMSISIQTNSNIELPPKAFLFDLVSYSDFVYFWRKYWYAVVIPVVILGIIYLIFMKRINRGFIKLKKFLTRPIKPDVSTFKLVFINFWLFLSNIFSVIFSLWKANKKRLVISLLGLTILASIIFTSATLYDSKASNLIIEFAQNADFGNNNAASTTFNLDLMSLSESDPTLINPNITEQTLDEIMYGIQTKSQILPKLIRNSYFDINTRVVGFQISQYEDITEMTYRGYMANYSTVFGSFLESGRLPVSENEGLLPSSMASVYGIELNDVIIINATTLVFISK